MLSFDSADLPPEEQFSAWAAFMAYHRVRPLGPGPGFHAKAKAIPLGEEMLTLSDLDRVSFERDADLIRSDGADHYTVTVTRGDPMPLDVGRGFEPFGPGALLLLDLTRSMRQAGGGGESIVLMLRRDFLDDVVQPFDIHGLQLSGGFADVLAEHLWSLAAHMERITPAEGAASAGTLRLLLAACLESRRPPSAAVAQVALRARARRLVGERMDRPLDVQALARDLGISRTALYRLFEPQGGVAAYLQRRRLSRVHALLLRPGERRTLGALAFAHGFNSLADFSRQYRARYGHPPSLTRARAAPQSLAPRGDATVEAFTAWNASDG